MKKKYVINRQDYFLTEKQVLNKLERMDDSLITDGFLMDYEDEISLDLNTKIQVLLENQEGYNRAISYENKIYYDQLERTSDDPEIKQKGPIMKKYEVIFCKKKETEIKSQTFETKDLKDFIIDLDKFKSMMCLYNDNILEVKELI